MNSREHLLTALNRREPDWVPQDLGSTEVTGIQSGVLQESNLVISEVLGAYGVDGSW